MGALKCALPTHAHPHPTGPEGRPGVKASTRQVDLPRGGRREGPDTSSQRGEAERQTRTTAARPTRTMSQHEAAVAAVAAAAVHGSRRSGEGSLDSWASKVAPDPRPSLEALFIECQRRLTEPRPPGPAVTGGESVDASQFTRARRPLRTVGRISREATDRQTDRQAGRPAGEPDTLWACQAGLCVQTTRRQQTRRSAAAIGPIAALARHQTHRHGGGSGSGGGGGCGGGVRRGGQAEAPRKAVAPQTVQAVGRLDKSGQAIDSVKASVGQGEQLAGTTCKDSLMKAG
ncbi:unnamed protein product [Protopolystoma xenopodis]|uniref:Uncharacterized protein n=1 Tax=Protopolystoma xenopodis TaxID=117903 RepID=A0A448XNE3_9PLAT|nr:unnamed protein product [Protopolystoma xenopodis]